MSNNTPSSTPIHPTPTEQDSLLPSNSFSESSSITSCDTQDSAPTSPSSSTIYSKSIDGENPSDPPLPTPVATPLPWNKLLLILLMLAANAITANLLFSFVGYMVYDLGVTDDKSSVGFYSGYLTSAYFLSQTISCFFWSSISDKYGRRRILLMGLFADSVSLIMLGFSFDYKWAIASRAFGGFFNALSPVAKAYIGDVTDDSNKAKGFSYFGMMWGIGSLIGPVIGGFLAQPATKFPLSKLFGEFELFIEFPYLLPCAVASAISGSLFIVSLFYLGESTPMKTVEMLNVPEGESDSENSSKKKMNQKEEQKKAEEDDEKDLEAELLVLLPNTPQTIPYSSSSSPSLSTSSTSSSNSISKLYYKTTHFFYKYRHICITIFNYIIIAVCWDILDEIIPIWGLAQISHGGLDMSTTDIAIVLLIGATSFIVYQRFIFNPLIRKFGLIPTNIFGAFVGVCVFVSVSILPRIVLITLGGPYWMALAVLSIIVAFKSWGDTTQFTCINIMINISSPGFTGKANGIAYALAGMFRSVGPAAGTTLLAWTMTGKFFGLNHNDDSSSTSSMMSSSSSEEVVLMRGWVDYHVTFFIIAVILSMSTSVLLVFPLDQKTTPIKIED